jgi:hypothetical protein
MTIKAKANLKIFDEEQGTTLDKILQESTPVESPPKLQIDSRLNSSKMPYPSSRI